MTDVVVVLILLVPLVICVLKGKLATGGFGLIVGIVGIVGSIRLAKPTSWWARRFYGSDKLTRSQARFAD